MKAITKGNSLLPALRAWPRFRSRFASSVNVISRYLAPMAIKDIYVIFSVFLPGQSSTRKLVETEWLRVII